MARRRLRLQAQADGEGEVPGVTSLQFLATGGNSTVYRAWQPDLARWVAVKVLGLTLADGRARDRFLRECSAVGRLTGHPNIVTVLASGVTRTDRPFLTMDLFERGSLADAFATSGPVPMDLTLRYGVKLAGALETAHRAGILHRDLKPENVLLSRFGEPGLADFGIATLGEARGGTEAFTPTHAAPEVLAGQKATAAADVYGLASTLWTALAGRLPFGDSADGPLKLMLRVLQEPLPPLERPDVPSEVEEALRWALAKDPADRAPTAVALGERLRTLQADLGLPVSELVVPDDLGSLGAPPSPGSAIPAPPRLRPRRPRAPSPPTAGAAATIRPWPSDGQPSGPEAGAAVPRRHDDAWAPPGAGPAGQGFGGRPEPAGPRSGFPPPPSGPPDPLAASRLPPAALAPPEPGPTPVPGLSPGLVDHAATVVRPRAGFADAGDGEPAARRRPNVAVLVVGGALLLAVALIAGATIATRGGSGPVTSTTASVIVTTTRGGPTTVPPPPRAATDVRITLANPTTALVRWKAPTDRNGLLGFVVLYALKDGTGPLKQQADNNPAATEMAVVLDVPGPRCFVVQAYYAFGKNAPSDRICP